MQLKVRFLFEKKLPQIEFYKFNDFNFLVKTPLFNIFNFAFYEKEKILIWGKKIFDVDNLFGEKLN